MKRATVLLLLVALMLGCGTLNIPPGPGLPHGAELSAIGEASARATIGPKITTHFDDTGAAVDTTCEQVGVIQCIAYEVKGGAFTGWQIILSVVSAGFTIFGAANN